LVRRLRSQNHRIQKNINKESNASVNKLIVLEKAKQLGLKVPIYYLAENTLEVILDETITKSFSEDMYFENIFENVNAIGYTAVIDKKVKNNFYPTFFQEKVEKDFEIRSFYLDNKIWSVAIISQNDDQTKTDFRKYNKTKPNRNICYNLPKEIEEKIDLLMKSLDLNCGSIDLIKSGNDFYFLEINPVGQFLGVSFKCNYNLEKEIAIYL
jgi:ATP-GRASP peptide maturase of grasp-with-spasm system